MPLEDSMYAVLKSEVTRYRSLMDIVQSSLAEVVAACDGQLAMNAELEEVVGHLSCQRTPELWLAQSYLCMKPLAAYTADLLARVHYVGEWIESGPPAVFWLPCLFSTQFFLTGTLQTFARKHGHSMDLVHMDFQIQKVDPVKPADSGTFVGGLYLTGCRWDTDRGELTEPENQVVIASCPTIWLLPCANLEATIYESHFSSEGTNETVPFQSGPRGNSKERGNSKVASEHLFECPVYIVPRRHETLARKSYQRNFVIDIPFRSSMPHSHWTRRGAAALTQLDT